MYTEDKTHYLGASRIGSDVAEREALFWALMWRIGRNSRIPTCFRPDNQMVIGQADGTFGARQRDTAFDCLRGAYQLLEATMSPEALQLCHVRGHSGEPWNDFVDVAAKSESKRSHYHDRQPIDIRQWIQDLPYLWTWFDDRAGLPPLSQQGHCPVPPDLPVKPFPQQFTPDRFQHVEITISLCSGNVQALYRGPEGHQGKIHYLRAQMQSLCLNVMGLQETRSEAGTTCVDSVLRLAGGADRHFHGVELWVNLAQPFAHTGRRSCYFEKRDFTVVKATPRLLIVHVVNVYIDCWFIVGYAPHSGRPAQERQQWWDDFAGDTEALTNQQPKFIMLDANAASGPRDHRHVGPHDDGPSSNTPLLRDFLKNFELCLPATFDCHQGPQTTWTRPDGALECRID